MLLSLPVGTFRELSIEKQLLTIATWAIITLIFVMVGMDGPLWPAPVGALVGVLVGLVVAWAVAVALGE